MAGRNYKINQMLNGMPQVDDVLVGWEVTFLVNYSYQIKIDGEFINRSKIAKVKGVLQPLRPEEVELKPEGQRSWTWYQLHVSTEYAQMAPGNVVTINNLNYKVMALKDYSLNGYTEYHLIRDYQGSVA